MDGENDGGQRDPHHGSLPWKWTACLRDHPRAPRYVGPGPRSHGELRHRRPEKVAGRRTILLPSFFFTPELKFR